MLAGNNVAYRRAVLEKYADVLSEGRWEDALHDAKGNNDFEVPVWPLDSRRELWQNQRIGLVKIDRIGYCASPVRPVLCWIWKESRLQFALESAMPYPTGVVGSTTRASDRR